MSETAKRLRVHGRVQGVFYRAWTVEAARNAGVRGWVRNRRDGTVEILVRGADEAVAGFIARCWQGPPAARIDRIEAEPAEEDVPEGFEQRPTA